MDKILLAESSSLIRKIISSQLEENGFEVISFSDGRDAAEFVLKNKISCIVSDTNLKTVSGFQFAFIVKNSFKNSATPFILFTTGKEKDDFYLKNSGANSVVLLEKNGIERLILTIKENLSVKPPAKEKVALENFSSEQNSSDLALTLINEIEHNNHYFWLLNSIVKLFPFVYDFEKLILEIFKTIHSISPFDACAIFLKEEPVSFYFSGIENSQIEENSFFKISSKDFLERSKLKPGFPYQIHKIDFLEAQNPVNFCSYADFSIEGAEFTGTLHIAQTKTNFSSKETVSLEYFCKNLGFVLQQAIQYKKSTYIETKLRSAFSKFVPPEIIDDLIKNDSKEEKSSNEKRKVAILICDIRNFTNISEINQPEDVVEFLNSYFKKMVSVIKKHGGSIDKFMGDAIMALFGAPISYVDNTSRAVNAALEMISVLPEISCARLKLPQGTKFDIGIGLHYGEVIVGNIGCEEKIDYTVIGDSANLASRLEGLTKRYGAKIILSEAVKENLKDGYNIFQVDKVKVKGKKLGVKIYRADLKPLNKKYMETYEKGLNLYMKGAFNLAISYFEEALTFFPDDKASSLMKERCLEFMEKPPENWDGAISLTSK